MILYVYRISRFVGHIFSRFYNNSIAYSQIGLFLLDVIFTGNSWLHQLWKRSTKNLNLFIILHGFQLMLCFYVYLIFWVTWAEGSILWHVAIVFHLSSSVRMGHFQLLKILRNRWPDSNQIWYVDALAQGLWSLFNDIWRGMALRYLKEPNFKLLSKFYKW